MEVIIDYELIDYISEDTYFKEQLLPIKKFILALSMCTNDELKKWFEFDETGMITDVKNSFLIYKNEHDQKCLAGYEYYIFKKDNTKRKITIPNPVAYFMFCYNTSKYSIEISHIYDVVDNSKIANIFSKVYGRYHFLYYMYDNVDVDWNDKFQCNSPYSINQRKTLLLSAKYRHVMYIDLEDHYNNIYTHVIDRIGKEENDHSIPKEYFKFLDRYSMLVNGNETNGIITGPFSSKLISELLLTHIDSEIIKIISSNELDIEYTRFVDDYHFYCNNQYHLEMLFEELEKIFFKYRQKINNRKVNIQDTIISNNDSYNIIKGNVDSILTLDDNENYDGSNEEELEEFYLKNEIFVKLAKLLSTIKLQDSFSMLKQYIIVLDNIINDECNHFINEMLQDDQVKMIIEEFFVTLLNEKKFLSKEIISLIGKICTDNARLVNIKEQNNGTCIDKYLDIINGVKLFSPTRPTNMGEMCQSTKSMNEINYIVTKVDKKIDNDIIINIRKNLDVVNFEFSAKFIDSLYY